uniref:StAR-related lipid transfer protein 7, mitochondrial n=1 Tax=Anthurium amnicola TaxID=1678845 RepID=A0A1D1YN27_9ARAE
MATEGAWWWYELARRPAVVEAAVDVLICAVPIWAAVIIGLVIGWSWRPRWTGIVFLGLRGRLRPARLLWALPPGLGAGRIWLAFTALSALSLCRRLWNSFKGKRDGPAVGAAGSDADEAAPVQLAESSGFREDKYTSEREHDILTDKDLQHFLHLLDDKVGDAAWQHMMEHTTKSMFYQAWRREPKVGPLMLRSRTIFEDANPDLVRDFFWDDDFRLKWDPMLAYFEFLEESLNHGTSIVHWIKKFPFFCKDREYIIGRRIWQSGKTYYCVTKGVPYPSLKKKEQPRRVEVYFSSWRIRAVESHKQDGQLSACEVTLIHYEDMGIPKDVAKVGLRHGMWGAVKRLHSGLRAYQQTRKVDCSLSRNALMARNTTLITSDGTVRALENEASETQDALDVHKREQAFDWKWVLIGGTVAVVFGIQTGIIKKAILFGAARRLARK